MWEERKTTCFVLLTRVGTVSSSVCYIKMSVFLIVLSVNAVNMCVHAGMYTTHLLEWKEGEENTKG